MRRAGLHHLKLVFTPFSNQEGEWFWNDDEMRQILSESKLYMIGQRREVFFRNFRTSDAPTDSLVFDLDGGDHVIHDVELPIGQFKTHLGAYKFELREKAIRIFSATEDHAQEELIHWFTPDRLMYYWWHDAVEVRNLESFRALTRFYLYYVGVSKKGDSFSRLFRTAHEGRSRILGNERQVRDTGRLTDELMLFLFKVTDTQVHTLSADDEIPDEFLSGFDVSLETMAADAEKAFVSVLKTKYNVVRYSDYPKSKDGLYDTGYDAYGFFIEEDITFVTDTESIRGYHTVFTDDPALSPDAIMVTGDRVTLLKSGTTD